MSIVSTRPVQQSNSLNTLYSPRRSQILSSVTYFNPTIDLFFEEWVNYAVRASENAAGVSHCLRRQGLLVDAKDILYLDKKVPNESLIEIYSPRLTLSGFVRSYRNGWWLCI